MSSPSSSSIAPSVLSRFNTNGGTQNQGRSSIEQQELSMDDALNRLEIENRLKEGAENLLQVLDTRTREKPKEARETRRIQVMEELNQTNARIASLKARIGDLNAINIPSKSYRRQRSDEMLNSRPKLATINSSSSTKEAVEQQNDLTWNIADVLADLGQVAQESAYYIAKINDLVHLLRRDRGLPDLGLPQASITSCLIRFCSSSSSNLVAAGYRLARYTIRDAKSASFVTSIGIERCIITSLSKDQKDNTEREQAVKVVRAICMAAPELVSAGIVRAMVALAESDDRLGQVALQSLAEFALLCPSVMGSNGGMRCLLDSLVDGSSSLSDEFVMVVVYALDTPSTRKFLIPGRDLDIIFSPFTEYVEGKKIGAMEERLLSATTVVARMLNSWPGLLGLSMYGFQGIRSIIDALRVPTSMVRESILDFLFNALSISVNNMTSTFLAGRRLTTLGRIPIAAETASTLAAKAAKKQRKQSNLLNQLSALKLSLFLDVGLLDALMMVVEDKLDIQASRKATLLVGEVLQLSNTLLPLSRCRTLQALPRLFSSAADLHENARFSATAALFQIESLNRTRHKSNISRIVNSADIDNNKRGQRQVEQVKIKMGLQIDDSHFRNLLLDTQVLSTKNYTKWHWDTLTELVQGPLLNPKRLEESIRATKFMKRLLAFYRPFTHRFSAIKNTKPNQKYVKFGCLLLNTLLANPEGVKYLMESKLLRQLSECLAQMDPMNQVTASDALFSKLRLEETLCHGYFDLIGTLTSHPQGVAMMERWRMFSSLYHLTDLRSRGDLLKLFLKHMDYTHEGHPRIIISKALTTSLLDVRLFATEHLSSLITHSNERSRKTADWAIRLLITQLYDPHTEICEAAVRVLEEACNAREHLEYIVELRPALDHLGEVGGPLLLRFLATSIGFHYLKELNYIDREMDDWFHGRNDEFVTQIEATLLQTLAPVVRTDSNVFHGHTPAHFYGELAKTVEGVALLLEKGHFNRYVETLQLHWQEDTDMSIVHKVKAALWAIGSIGATERGAPFLKGCQVIDSIVKIAEVSQVATLKGTAYLILGMLSTTTVGVDLLQQYNWYGVVSNMGAPTGICVPDQISRVLNLQPWDTDLISTADHGEPNQKLQDPLSSEMVRAMADLGNHILANEAAKTLIRLRQKYPNKFYTQNLYDHAFHLLSMYAYRLPVRKFMLELFSLDVLSVYLHKLNHVVRPSRGLSLPKELSSNEYDSKDSMTGHKLANPGLAIESDDGDFERTPRPVRTRSHRSATVM